MSPREANNTFADQDLCLDYEGGVAMLPHDPTPPMALDVDDNDDDNDEQGGGGVATATAPETTAAAIGTGGNMPENLLNSSDSAENGRHSGGRSSRGTQSPVDPLSIDPTSDEQSHSSAGGGGFAVDLADALNGVSGTGSGAQGRRVRSDVGRLFWSVSADAQQQHTISPLNSGYSGVVSVESTPARSHGGHGDVDNSGENTPLPSSAAFFPPSPARSNSTTTTNDNNVHRGGPGATTLIGRRSVSHRAHSDGGNGYGQFARNSSAHVPDLASASASSGDFLADGDDASSSLDDGVGGNHRHPNSIPGSSASAFSEVNPSSTGPYSGFSGPGSPEGRSIRRNAAFDDYQNSPLLGGSPPTRIATRLIPSVDPGGATPQQQHGQPRPSILSASSSADSSLGGAGAGTGWDGASHPSAAAQPILSFGPHTTLADLKYFAERGCIVALLSALDTPRLAALGARMLADYAKNPSRRVAVAGNKRILEFTLKTMQGRIGSSGVVIDCGDGASNESRERYDLASRERAVEYAVETVRSLTATEESDKFLMGTVGLLPGLAALARGGFVSGRDPDSASVCHDDGNNQTSASPPISPAVSPISPRPGGSRGGSPNGHGYRDVTNRRSNVIRSISRSVSRGSSAGSAGGSSNRARSPGALPSNGSLLVSASPGANVGPKVMINSKSRLHACIAIMNLSCGKSNKIEIAKIPEVLTAMRDVMTDAELNFSSPTRLSSSSGGGSSNPSHAAEARLKATTCVKNLSNSDANDAALLDTPGLIEALGHVILVCIRGGEGLSSENGEESEAGRRGAAARATTTVTNACLALMNLSIAKANKHRVFQTPGVMEALMAVITRGGGEARVKSCSALSNLAIGYDNKIPMFRYPGFVEAILHVIEVDRGEARTKACSILWSFAAEMRNQVPVVQRGDILPILVRVAEEDATTEARFKCVAALTLLAESTENAIALLESGALAPLMDILHTAGPDPTQWNGQTASWCVGFLMNMAQSDEAVPALRNAGVVELLAPLLTLDHYQSLKAAMAVTFVCRYDEGDETYDLLRKTETVIPKIINLLHNTLSGKGGNGYKYGVFTLRSSVGCIASLASGPDFMKERIATAPVYESLLRVLADFCVDRTPGAIVGGGRDDAVSPTLAVQALHDLTGHLIPSPGTPFPFGPLMEERLITALAAYERSDHSDVKPEKKQLAREVKLMLMGYGGGLKPNNSEEELGFNMILPGTAMCCGADINRLISPSPVQGGGEKAMEGVIHSETDSVGGDVSINGNAGTRNATNAASSTHSDAGSANGFGNTVSEAVRTFLLSDGKGRRFAVPIDPSGGRSFNDNRVWCYRRGRFCLQGEIPDPNFRWTPELQRAYSAALEKQQQQKDAKSPGGGGSNAKSDAKQNGTMCIPRSFC